MNSFTLSPIIISERKSGKCVRQKRKKRSVSSKKKKKNEQRASSCIGLKVSSSCLKRACHKIASGEEEKKILHLLVS